jgi:hypothetical protein
VPEVHGRDVDPRPQGHALFVRGRCPALPRRRDL